MNNKFLDAFTTTEQLQSFLDWEKGLRQEIVSQIEEYRVNRCRCDHTLGKDCEALIEIANIIGGTDDIR